MSALAATSRDISFTKLERAIKELQLHPGDHVVITAGAEDEVSTSSSPNSIDGLFKEQLEETDVLDHKQAKSAVTCASKVTTVSRLRSI
jgi:hypothetical protein